VIERESGNAIEKGETMNVSKQLFAGALSLALGVASAATAHAGQTPEQSSQMNAPRGRARSISIDGQFTFPLDQGCRYDAEVHGSARPAGSAAGGEAVYNASGTIAASVACPGRAAVQAAENLSTPEPMTLPAIELAIEKRASLVTETGGRRCAYVPNFTLDARRLQGVGASLMCPSASEGATGGGPQPMDE
jgi:hypothetical protein